MYHDYSKEMEFVKIPKLSFGGKYRAIQSCNHITPQMSYGYGIMLNLNAYLYVSRSESDDSDDDALEIPFQSSSCFG